MNHIRSIQRNIIRHSCREVGGQFLHLGFHSFRDIQRIGTRLLINSNSRRRLPFQSGHHTVRSRSQINPGNIFQTEHGPILFAVDDNISELFGRTEPPLHIQCILKSILILFPDRLADISGRYFHILRLDRLINLLRWNIPDTHCFRIEPDTHGVIPCSHYIHGTHSGHTCQLVDEIQLCIIGQIQTVVNRILWGHCQEHDNIRWLFLYSDSLHHYGFGERWLCDAYPVLYLDGCHINIRTDGKCDRQRIGSRRRWIRGHIKHTVYPVHLLFDRNTYCLGNGFGICPRINSRYLYRWRCNLRKLRYRQYIECHQTGYYNQQGKDGSKYRSVDKKLRKHKIIV